MRGSQRGYKLYVRLVISLSSGIVWGFGGSYPLVKPRNTCSLRGIGDLSKPISERLLLAVTTSIADSPRTRVDSPRVNGSSPSSTDEEELHEDEEELSLSVSAILLPASPGSFFVIITVAFNILYGKFASSSTVPLFEIRRGFHFPSFSRPFVSN